TAHRTTTQKLVDLNAIAPGEALRGGTLLLVPSTDGAIAAPTAVAPGPKQSVVVPADVFVYPDRRRVFYRVQIGDTLKEIASALHVGMDDLDRWNDIDPGARLQEGMTLQAFVPEKADLTGVVTVPESDLHVLAVGSDEFFASLEHDKNIRRVVVTAKAGDTLESIGRRFDVPVRTMERVNRRGRSDALHVGDTVVVYAPAGVGAGGTAATASTSDGPVPLGPLPPAPVPDLLP
ncbi:MAG TPA: LysM peptidoglycan-binding domain-containing protein, partial [Polyangiaceae bacterium]